MSVCIGDSVTGFLTAACLPSGNVKRRCLHTPWRTVTPSQVQTETSRRPLRRYPAVVPAVSHPAFGRRRSGGSPCLSCSIVLSSPSGAPSSTPLTRAATKAATVPSVCGDPAAGAGSGIGQCSGCCQERSWSGNAAEPGAGRAFLRHPALVAGVHPCCAVSGNVGDAAAVEDWQRKARVSFCHTQPLGAGNLC